MPRRPRPQTAEEFLELMLELASTVPGAGDSLTTMAQAIGVDTRTLQRWRRKFDVKWPPIGDADWQAILSQARAAQPRAAPTWVVTITINVTAPLAEILANLTEVNATLGEITDLRIGRPSSDATDTRHSGGLS